MPAEPTFPCVICGEPARFLTPAGTMCPTDALLAAVLQTGEAMEWVPVLIASGSRPSGEAALSHP